LIYLIGGAPRSGKSILGQQIAARLGIGWISTDLLMEVLRVKNVEGTIDRWNADSEAIAAAAEWLFPCLERFVAGVSSLAEHYLIEGVGFLPVQVEQLSRRYSVHAIFLGCSQMDLVRFDQFPGRSRGYAGLPEEVRRQFAGDIPRWSTFIRQEAERFGYPYLDMSEDFPARLIEAERVVKVFSDEPGQGS